MEPFSTVLFRTADIVALLTVGSEMTPICKANVNHLRLKDNDSYLRPAVAFAFSSYFTSLGEITTLC